MSERLADDLWVAVYDDNIHRVRTLLQQGANPSHPLYWREEWFNREYGSLAYRFPPLHTACHKGHLEIVKLLLQAGAGVDVGDGTYNSTPLHLACEGGQKEVAVYLIREAGCKVDVRDGYSMTPLVSACMGGNKELVQYLVEEIKCDVEARDKDNVTPLLYACKYGNKELVQFLVGELKCDVDVRDIYNATALHYASDNENKEVIQYLVEEIKCDVEVRDKNNITALHYVCENGNKELVQYLVEELKCDVDARTMDNDTPLHFACAYGHKVTAQYLVEEGKCDVDARNNKNETVLHSACISENKELVQYLVEDLKCDVDARTIYGRTPLHVACQFGHKDIVQYLVEEGKCDFDVTTVNGETPLDVARDQGHTEIVDYLKSLPQSSSQPGAVGTTNPQSSQPPTSEPPQLGAVGTTNPQSSQPPTSEPPQSVTPLSQEEADALRVVLLDNGVKPGEVSLEDSQSTLEKVQQMLTGLGHKELATSIRDKINKVIKEQKQHLKRLDKLMVDKDTIDLCYLKVFLVGPPGVGKTTTLNRLLHIIDNLCSAGDEVMCRSTLLANCIQVLAFISDDAAEWLSSEDADEETKLIFGLLKERLSEVLSSAVQEDTAGASLIPSSEGASRPWLSKLLSRIRIKRQTKPTKPQSVAGPGKASEFSTPTMHTKHRSEEEQRIAGVKARLQNLIKAGDYSKMARMVGNTLLNINDIGGQPGFLEMLPALSTGPAMYLVFLDLSKDLDKPYKIPFSRDTTIITPFDAIHTVESTISQILSAIASAYSAPRVESAYPSAAAFNRKFEQFQQISPVAALVGTHKDKLDDPDLRIKQADQVLKKTVQKFSSVLVTPPHSNTSFFPVDNYNGTEQSDIGPIRRFMNDVFSTHFKDASLPICPKWLIFGTIIRREYKIVKVDDCIELGGILEMDGEEIKFCIWYLDCIGTLMHYTNIANDEDGWFKNHVISSPQVIFDSTSQLIVASLRTLHSEGHVIEHERLELIKKGQFSIESIEKYCFSEEVTEKLKRDELIPASKLVKLLKHVNLLSSIIHKEADGERITYLMPAVLDCATQDELAAPHTPDTNHLEPLLITFKCGYVPTGTFCGLITQLVSRGPHGIFDFVWDLVEDGVKRNYVSFYVDYVNKVTLICHDRCYEVRVTRIDTAISLHDLCAHVLSVILYILKDLYEKLIPEVAFYCPCPDHRAERTIHNLCTLVDTRKLRFLCKRQPVTLEEAHQVWIGEHLNQFFSHLTKGNFRHKFGGSQQLTYQGHQGQLNLKEVKKFTNDARFKWFDIGIELDIDLHVLTDIRTRNRYVVDDCFTEMLSHWLSRPSPPPTWSALAKALTSPVIGRQDIAGTIKLEPESDSDQSMLEAGGFTLKEVRRITWEVRSEWRNLGSQLLVDAGTLDAIESTNRLVVDDCFTEMLSHWLKRFTPPPTWTELMDALKSPVIGHHDIAEKITKK